MLIPPINFSLVVGEFYRSGHPIELNYPFLETLNLKTIVYLGDRTSEENAEYEKWAEEQNIRYMAIRMKSVKEPFVLNDPVAIVSCLEVLSDKANYPVLVHSNKGKHRVGVLAGVYRRHMLGWSLAAIYAEYMRFAKGKADADFSFIEAFKPDMTIDLAKAPPWIWAPLEEQQVALS